MIIDQFVCDSIFNNTANIQTWSQAYVTCVRKDNVQNIGRMSFFEPSFNEIIMWPWYDMGRNTWERTAAHYFLDKIMVYSVNVEECKGENGKMVSCLQ